ncbi:hypothetical protein BDF22DRAFT_291246 [Syncephalis plumigaleata]|nr:hypothetical protein BDF22DRAFT_291246 [Syncephalis plumigaleata]
MRISFSMSEIPVTVWRKDNCHGISLLHMTAHQVRIIRYHYSHVFIHKDHRTIIDVNMQWQQGKHLVMNDGASINTSYTLDNNVDRHMLVQGYTPSNDRCLLSMYLVEIPSTKSYDILFLATNSLVEMREIMRAALSKVDMIDHLFDEPLYMSIDENDSTDVEHTTDGDAISNNIAVELIDGIMFLEGNMISYANDIDLSSKYLADIPIYNSKQGCIVWEISLSDTSPKYDQEYMEHYLGLYWKYTKSTDDQLVKNIAVYAFTSDQILMANEIQFSRIITVMESAASFVNNDRYMYTLPTGECFGISIDMPDDPTAKIGVCLYQKDDLIRNDNVKGFSELEGMTLNLSKHPYGFISKSARH